MINVQKNKEAFFETINSYKENFKGFFYVHRFYILVLIIAAYADGLSTIYFMEKTSPLNEIHPIIRYLAVNYGIVVGTIIGKVGQIVIGTFAIIYFRNFSKWLFVIAIISYTFASISNFTSF